MKLSNIIKTEYEDVSEKVVSKVVSPKKMEKLKYKLMPGQNTYAKGVHALRDSYAQNEAEVPSHLWYNCDGQRIVRPLTFRENLQARVDDFETLKNKDGSIRTIEDRLRLFGTWFDSCTGIAYSSNNDDFMIIPMCKELITIPRDFNDEYTQVDYASLQGKGFSLKRSQAKYDQQLTESEVISHPAWFASVEEDVTLLCMYVSVVFKHMINKDGKSMDFYLKDQIKKDQLMDLFVYGCNSNSIASGNVNLNFDGTSFLRATPLS